MWQKETNSDDRRFLKDIGPIIALAEEGDLAKAHGIVAYFCQKVTAGVIPDIRVTRFVSTILIKSVTPGQLKIWKRNRKIKSELRRAQAKGMILKPNSSNQETASEYVSDIIKTETTKTPEADRVLAIKYEDLPAPLILEMLLNNGWRPKLAVLQATLPDAADLHRKFLHPQNGKRYRSRLNLEDSRHPKLSKLIDQEDIEVMNQLHSEGHSITSASKIITKGFRPGIWEQVRKTWHRHKKKHQSLP